MGALSPELEAQMRGEKEIPRERMGLAFLKPELVAAAQAYMRKQVEAQLRGSQPTKTNS